MLLAFNSTLSVINIVPPSCLLVFVWLDLNLPGVIFLPSETPPFTWLNCSPSLLLFIGLFLSWWTDISTSYSFFSTLRHLLIYEFCRLITLVPPDLSKLKWTSWLWLCIYLYHIPDSPHLSGTNVKDTDFLAPFLRTSILLSKARESVSAIIQSDSCDSVIGGCHFPSTLWRSLLGIQSDWQRIWVTLKGKEEWSPCVQVLQLVPLLSDLYAKAADVFF